MLAVVAPLLHEYVLPPLAVKLTESPIHIAAVAGLIVIVGKLFTITALCVVLVQPEALVPVTR